MFRYSSSGLSSSLKSNGPVTSNCSIGVRSFKSIRSWILAVRRFTIAVSIVRFELDPLQFQAIQIHLSEIAGLEARAIHFQFLVPVSQVLLRVLKNRLRLQDVDERVPQVEHQAALLVQISRFRDGGGFLGLVAPQLPLVLAFVQIADAG